MIIECCVLIGFIHVFINVVDVWVNQHIFLLSFFMGMLPLGFKLYVWGVFKLVLVG
jgi:hypothetical protein